ncbi:serine/threonine-protein kinase MPS1 isoform X2 [Nymphaea colorata]|uniref:serine/threonine-protein kinase MPS1 isoform X2 n=1 Tax=Nymphaea colorata TaxID=210225 RepID=UPI00129E14BE|nr:serine/threonine-protein kinase MPS1 isoform X2 [Nymphaea colorata]
MEKEADLRPSQPVGERKLPPFSDSRGSAAPPVKIKDFLLHARAALQRSQQPGPSASISGRARRVLVAQADPLKDCSVSVESSVNSDVGNISDSLYNFVSEKPWTDLASGTGMNLTSMVQETKIDCRKRKGDSKVSSPDDTLFSSASNMKDLSSEIGNMGGIGSSEQYPWLPQPVPNARNSVDEGSRLMNIYASVSKDLQVCPSHGAVAREVFVTSHPSEQPCKSLLADTSQKVLSSSSVSVNPYAYSCEKQHPGLSNSLLMPTIEAKVDAMDTVASTSRSNPQWADSKIATSTGTDGLSSYFTSLAFTKNDNNESQPKQPAFENQDIKECGDMIVHRTASKEVYMGTIGSSAKLNADILNQKLISFAGKEAINSLTVSSAATSLQWTSAAPLNSVTYNPSFYDDINFKVEGQPQEKSDGNVKAKNEPTEVPHFDKLNLLSNSSSRPVSNSLAPERAESMQMSLSSIPHTSSTVQDQGPLEQLYQSKKETIRPSYGCPNHQNPKAKQDLGIGKEVSDSDNAVINGDMKSKPSKTSSSSNINTEHSNVVNAGKVTSSKETGVSRKRNYDPDVFFKVNGKHYQKLGKIGSGGSSEVYKVISSDCTIYALKKIKLKGRDYSTAYGFCQEIKYLNRLRGKKNIIQLIDYEVTDKRLLEEANNVSTTMKDGRITDDVCIYMVLEYGEIDLAHMLSQKWKEFKETDRPNMQMDENWLRFYWQQILEAVNTIHEDRIVHSDLKPANFLLVKGSLKLIDFGIAKAIQSDTTNIQRDLQVGTLNYMSPEAFMCNDQDSEGNTIKCGRPSDIWSLGCILYQMVYGRTPFAEQKTLWAKYKVITDKNHKITYGPVSNPWLVDLMKKCLAWDRNERWRIPQLLNHPFLAPPVPSYLPSSLDQQCGLLMQISEEYSVVPEVSVLCSQLKQLIVGFSRDTQGSL